MALRRLLAALGATTLALVAMAGTAHAGDLTAGDDRAVLREGNVDAGQQGACEKAGLEGTPILPASFTVTIDSATYIDITGLPAGVQITGVIVKGANGYNLYKALGALPLLDLHPPVNSSGKPAAISHWFACGTGLEQPPVEQPPAEQPPAEEPPAEQPPAEEEAAPTSTPAAAPAGAEANELAATGFGSPWLIALGSTLVVAGAGVLFFLRRKKA